MALVADTQTSYVTVGNREDLIDKIFRISPTECPFISGIEVGTATAVNHEWQIQELAAAAANAVLEGDEATIDAAVPTARRGNYCQISDKVAAVTGTQRSVDHAGIDDELPYQELLKGLELKRDMETVLIGTAQAKNAGAAATARLTASVLAWVATNDDLGATGTSPTAIDGTDARNDGTARAFTESQLKTVLQMIWNEGGKPDTIMVGGFNKQVFSTFTGRSTPQEMASSKKIVNNVTVYEGDFSPPVLKVMPNRFQRARDCWVFQMDMWKICYLPGRKFVSHALAKTGDSDKRQILSEYCLEASNEKASGLVADLTVA